MQKKTRIILSILFLILSYLFFFIGVKYISLIRFSWDLLILFVLIDTYLLLHFLLDIKKMYSFIYEKRYLIGILVFAFLVLFKFNGSSIEIYNKLIEPDNLASNSVVLGIPRSIRSDEWVAGTPLAVSQKYTKLNERNDLINGKENLVTLNPKLPNKNILSLITSPGTLGYLFLDFERGFSFNWYLTYFILFFSSFEMLMILTKKNKLYSLLGTILITFSPVIQWWQSPNIIAYGALAIVMFYNGIISKSKWEKVLFAVLLGYSGALYIMCLYPAWQVPYGYCFLALVLYLIFDNKENIKWKDSFYLIPVFLIIIAIVLPILKSNEEVFEITTNTVYPGARMSTGGGTLKYLFTYSIDCLFPFTKIDNPCELSQYFSLFPIPLLYALYLLFKNKKKDTFLLISSIISIMLVIWVTFPVGKFISKISLLYMSTSPRALVAIGYLSIIMLIYELSNYKIEIKINKILLILLSSVLSLFYNLYSYNFVSRIYTDALNVYYLVPLVLIFTYLIYVLLGNKKNRDISLLLILGFYSAFNLLISPINKGLSIFDTKPSAKEVSKIVKDEPDAKFIVTGGFFPFNNYYLASGAKVINSTNYIPNMEMYKILDPDKKYNDIYNRYAHLDVVLTDDDTSFKKIQDDYILLELKYEDMCKIGVDYIISTSSIEQKKLKINDTFDYNLFENKYNNSNIKIYKTNCER